LRAADPKRQDRAAVFNAWADELGTGGLYVTSELIAQANEMQSEGYFRPKLHAALLDIARDRAGAIDARRLGKWLAANESSVAADLKLTSDRNDATRPRWVLNHA